MSLYVRYLVCYDIAENRRRNKFFEFLKDLGLVSLQKSVFAGELNKAELTSLRRYVEQSLDEKTDKVFWLKTDISEHHLKAGIGYQHFTWISHDGNWVV